MESQHKNAKVLECFAICAIVVPRSYDAIVEARALVATSGQTERYEVLDFTYVDQVSRSGVHVRYM